ncbi:MAG: hypothetical protein V1798_07295 [Pseudomonadota bacterium]
MGIVGIAIHGTGDSSPFYNPAGLNDLTEGRFQFLAMTFDVAANSVRAVNGILDLKDDVNRAPDDAGKVDALNNYINKHSGEFDHLRWALDLVNYARKDFAVGLVIDERLDLSFRNQAFPNFDIRNLGDVALYVSGSHAFWEKLLQVGVTLRPTVRFALDQQDEQITYGDVVTENADGDPILVDELERIKNRRFGLGIDVGAKSDLSRFDWIPGFAYLKPSVGVTWQDIGSPSFSGAEPNGQSVGVGVAVFPAVWKLKNTVSFDIRDLNRERDFITRTHFGAESELRWKKLGAALRAGLTQGYLTAGLTMDFWLLKIDGAYYNEEVGIKTREGGNTRYAVTISFNI